MELIMTKEEEIYNNVTLGSCHQCEYGELAQAIDTDVEPKFECTIDDIKQCPVVIHDMSL
jgi:hypothetical protein